MSRPMGQQGGGGPARPIGDTDRPVGLARAGPIP